MQITQATLSDLSVLAPLFDAYRVFYEKESNLDGAMEFLEQRIRNRDSTIFMVKDEQKGIGFTQLYPLFSSVRMARLWLLNDLYVIPEYRGKGASKLLIARAKAFAKETNAAGVALETARTNIIGNNLYPRVGFKVDSEIFIIIFGVTLHGSKYLSLKSKKMEHGFYGLNRLTLI